MTKPLTLPKEIRKNGKTYKQVKRVGNVALYDTYTLLGDKGKKKQQRTSCEVFVVRIQRETIAPNGVVIPEKEKYPSNEDFGHYAWSFPARSKIAEEKFTELLTAQKESADETTETNITVSAPTTTKKQRSSKKASNSTTIRIDLDEHVILRCFANGTVMATIDNKPKGPKPHLIRAAVELKGISQKKAETLKIKELINVVFKN